MDREDSSTYTTQPTAAPQPPANAPYAQPKRKRSKAPLVLMLLLLAALIVAGALGWLLQQQSASTADANTSLTAANQKIADLKVSLKRAESASSSTTTTTTTTTKDSATAALVTDALAYSKAKVANQGYPATAKDLEATVDKQTNTFARVQVGSKALGPGVDLVYFKKSGSDWQLIGSEGGDPTKFRQTFGIPSDF